MIGPRNVREETVVEAIVHRNGADAGAPWGHGVGYRAWKLRDLIDKQGAKRQSTATTPTQDPSKATESESKLGSCVAQDQQGNRPGAE